MMETNLESKKNKNMKTKFFQNQTDEFYYDEEDLLQDYEKDFAYQIKERGSDYYHSDNILSLFKNKNEYIAKVSGSNFEIYDVVLKVDQEGIHYNCTCPCTFPCKHEYAILMAISNREYKEIQLKEPIQEKDAKLKTILEKIPAEELKKYVVSEIDTGQVAFQMESFSNYFRKYYPLQKYDYYYNNLYNALIIEDETESTRLTKSYFSNIKQYIAGSYFDEVVNIIMALIQAYKDANQLNFNDDIIDLLPNIGMFLRVTYRKSDEQVQRKIKEWISKLEAENFYNNYYLEDIMFSVKELQF